MIGYWFQKILSLLGNILFTRLNALIAVEGVVVGLKTGRNCIGLSSTALKLYAQSKVVARD